MLGDSGVQSYITGKCVFENGFPVDQKGHEHVCCEYCRAYIGKRCILTNEIVPFPSTHVGEQCPFEFEEPTAAEIPEEAF